MKSTKPKFGSCARCKKLVFEAWSDGLLTVVDVQPLDGPNYRAALIAQQWTYDILTDRMGNPVKLKKRTQFSPWTEDSRIVRQHACKLVKVNYFEVGDSPKVKTAVSFSSVGKDIVPACLRGMTEQVAETATHPPFKRYINRVCDNCKEIIGDDWDIVGVQVGEKWQWVAHVTCPPPKPPRDDKPAPRRPKTMTNIWGKNES